MMRHRFVHIAFAFPNRLKVAELEPVFTAIGDDWVRISILSWILWTNKPAPHIYTLLQPHLEAHDQVAITGITSDFYGLLQPWVWQWINSKVTNWATVGADADAMRALPASMFSDDASE